MKNITKSIIFALIIGFALFASACQQTRIVRQLDANGNVISEHKTRGLIERDAEDGEIEFIDVNGDEIEFKGRYSVEVVED